ncbi:hypothetical protein PsorP6_005526 [Peronosclerospora sorghi]|uniref:Uncharacterized protein n=1 Tax=Peronosclerospora sorghi TaxID=230839 RepID=A0ACC0W2Q3_9STRA|nr:hypothetical protein PsorP6_005526 [Peronosclerospora sorghi]
MELETEHVRMLDAGRQRVAYSSPQTTNCFASVSSTKTQLLQHGNTFGLSFVSTEKGFVMTKNDELETSRIEYITKRQEAMDHGQKLTMEEIQSLPVTKEIQLPSVAYWIALSPDEATVAVAYADSLALFEVAHILEAITPTPFHTFTRLQAQEVAWCTDSPCDQLAVLTLEKQVTICSLDGVESVLDAPREASSISWSPSGTHLAVGLIDGTIAVYDRRSLQIDRSITRPPCYADAEFEVHHVNWVEDELILAGYYRYDDEREETSALACIFERGKCFELDEVVGFFDVERRRHQFFSVFLPEWRMFFIGCSLSPDIELLVSDPDGGEWELWKPLENYQARLPMNAHDEESFLMGLALNLNSTTPVSVDDDAFSPVPVVSCANTEGFLIHFAFVDTTVHVVDFIKRPVPFHHSATHTTKAPTKELEGVEKTATMELTFDAKGHDEIVSLKNTNEHGYGQNDENEFAESDHVSSDEEAERKEEEEKARTTFHSVASDGADFILSEQFPKLFKAMGSTYSEEEHASIVESLEKGGKIYEMDFVAWYVDWIMGEEDLESDEEASLATGTCKMKSKEEIQAAFSKFTVKEGSWKCAECLLSNDPKATKCSACETPNPAAPKGVTAATPAHAPAAGSIGSGGFSFPVSTGDGSKSSTLSFGAPPSTPANVSTNISGAFLFGGNSAAASGLGINSFAATKDEIGDSIESGDTGVVGDVKDLSNAESVEKSESTGQTSTIKETKVLHEYGQSDENEFAESDGDESDEEEERKEDEAHARNAFRSVAMDGADFITREQFPKLFKTLGSTYSDEKHGRALESLEKDGKVYELDFIAWYLDWIFAESDADADDTSASFSPRYSNQHEYGQNDENEFAESDHVSSDEEAEREEEEEKARTTFHSIASDGADFILSEQLPKLFKAMGSTYSEKEHASIVESLEKGGKIYEMDFVAWYVDWIMGEEDLESDEEASLATGTCEMKSKEEIQAAFSKFTVKEGSWKCVECLLSNDPKATKCSACETPNPAAPKGVTAATPAHAPAAGSIGSGGFSFPVSTGDGSKSSTLSFGAPPSTPANVNTNISGGFLFGSNITASGLSFSSSPSSSTAAAGLSFGESTIWKADAGLSFGATRSSIVAPSIAKSGTESSDTSLKPKSSASGGYPPDTTSKPKPPPAFGAISNHPDTTLEPKISALGDANSGNYPPDTTSKPKPPTFGAASSGSYPPDTTSKPKPPAFGSSSSSSYPPDTTSKPKPPAFGAASSSSYPPDTTSKPKPPAFGSSSNGGCPPDTTSKPNPPAFSAASSGSYPPDTTSKPKPPAFSAASSGSYPPDTTSKPKPPAFSAASSGSYPPDTTSKPEPLAFGSSSNSSYPPDTTSKLPVFGAANNSSYPPDTTSKPKPPTFGITSKSGNSWGKTVMSGQSTTKSNFSFGSVFGASGGTTKAVNSSSSPFGVVPTGAFSMQSVNASDLKDVARKTNVARPTFSMDSLSATMATSDASADQLPTQRTLNFDDCSVTEAKTASMQVVASPASSKGVPSSQMEGQLWKLIVDFDKTLKRLHASSSALLSRDPAFSKSMEAKLDKLRTPLSALCARINDLDKLRDELEKNVLFVIGSDGDVHEQLEYSREILKSFNDEGLKRTLEAQPLDQRSKETWESLKTKLKEVETCCLELERHVETGNDTVMSSSHLFRVLKQTYDSSKLQYNKVCNLADELSKLTMSGDRRRPAYGLGVADDGEAPHVTKAEMMQVIREHEQRSQDTRRRFLALCNNVVTPRDVFTTPRRKVTPRTTSTSPLRVKASSKLMPKTQLSVASPMSSVKRTGRSMAVQSPSVPPGSKLVSLAENMTPRHEPAKLVPTPQVAKNTLEVGKAPQRPSLGVPATKPNPDAPASTPANVFSFSDPFKKVEGSCQEAVPSTLNDTKTVSSTSSSDVGVTSASVKSKPKAAAAAGSSVAFLVGGKDVPGSASGSTTDYRALLQKFYKVHNPSKLVGSVMEKALATYKGREKDLFARLFSMYVPDATPDELTKYLKGGPVPPKRSESVESFANALISAVQSPFRGASAAQPSPFGASPSAFSLAPSVTKSPGLGAFGSAAISAFSTASTPSTPFGRPAVDYRQKLIEFYQKHNPAKLSSVDATLEKYKGNEAKLFQNLAAKYKVDASVVVPPAKPNAAASPFGKPGAFSAPSAAGTPTFGAASVLGFGDAKPSPAASPFGAPSTPASSPFGAPAPSGFGFQATSASTPQFGAPSPFGTTASGFGGAPAGVNYREKLTAFYQQHNPAKLSSVDATLEKYRGREEHLFAMLEQKYLKKTLSTSGGFGIPSSSTFGTSAFGTPSTSFGGASATPAFGSASTLGNAGFGGTSGAGFGGFSCNTSAATGGATSGSGFGAFGSQTPSFSGMTQDSSGFGANAPSPEGFGSTPSGFGQPSAFTTASFTQMR